MGQEQDWLSSPRHLRMSPGQGTGRGWSWSHARPPPLGWQGPSASVGPSLGATQRAVGTAPRENRAGPHPLDSRPQPVFQQEEFVSKP